ncbi:MAG: bifunctional 4-hydroxy-2-oxoglutarate aldolase/2-dehydro-3-deoxy-phosphogluconate aldolase [Eubacteriales bacterium]|nr:bifunctional 4-hydroxy-2-oxoglutarate aldolase/2-dehydro-3-deoxy-phosphogluconate aldolase [Eubacteriales bacterium]
MMDDKTNMTNLMQLTGICPILAMAEPDAAVPAAQALVKGGLPMMEILLKNETSVQNLAKVAREVPEMYVGAGTVLTAEQAEKVIDLGAKFVVLPGFSRSVVEVCLKRNVMVLPGCVTATEIMMALDYGIKVVKFFPVFQMGGTATLAQFNGGPFPDVKFVVTGALDSSNFLPLVEYPGTMAAGGDWMFQDHSALKNRDYEQIARNMRESVCRVQDMRGAKTRR